MSNRRAAKGNGKAIIIDLTIDEPDSNSGSAKPVQGPIPVTPHRNTQIPNSTNGGGSSHAMPSTPSRAGPSNRSYAHHITPTPGSKRTASQARITAFFPSKKGRVDPIPFKLTKEEEKTEYDARKLAEEENRVAKMDAKRLARELEREEREQKKAEKNKWKADWNAWVTQHRQPDAKFAKPKESYLWDIYVNATGIKDEYGLNQRERECVPHYDMKNPRQPPGQAWAPMKIFRRADVELLAWRKEGVLTGVSQDDEEALLKEGERHYKARKGEQLDESAR